MTLVSLVLAATVVASYNDGTKGVPLAPGSSVSGAVAYKPEALQFVFSGKGEPTGRFTVQVRPGARNLAEPVAPFACEVENRVGGAVTDLLAPTCHTRTTPGFVAKAETKATDAGWKTTVSFPFRGRLKWWPITDGAKRSLPWWATVRYTDAAGKATDWGTPDDPLQIAWGRKPPFGEARDGLFRDHDLVEAYRPMLAKYGDVCEYSQKEKWIGFVDPGVETFAWREAASEKLFYDRYGAAIADEFAEALKLLEWGWNPKEQRRDKFPKSLELSDPAKSKLFPMIDNFNYASDRFTAARREYLTCRFMGRELAAASKTKAKKSEADDSQPKAPDLSADEKGSISLDDEELQF